jgi:hypothetical protein
MVNITCGKNSSAQFLQTFLKSVDCSWCSALTIVCVFWIKQEIQTFYLHFLRKLSWRWSSLKRWRKSVWGRGLKYYHNTALVDWAWSCSIVLASNVGRVVVSTDCSPAHPICRALCAQRVIWFVQVEWQG